jgi:hypothetical protein
MAAVTGINGAVTSWANNTHLISTGSKPFSFNLTMEGDNLDSTSFSSAGVGEAIKGLTGWYVEMEGWTVLPCEGSAGLVTFTAGYTTLLDSWELEVQGTEYASTAFGDTVRKHVPGGFKWGGSFAGKMDDTTAAAAISNASEPATGTFKYQERGATDNALSGSIFTYGAQFGVTPNALNSASYQFQGSGALTQSNPATGEGIIPDGALAVATPGSLVLTASSGRTFTGSAFWTRIAVSCRVGELVRVRLRARGSDSLSIA